MLPAPPKPRISGAALAGLWSRSIPGLQIAGSHGKSPGNLWVPCAVSSGNVCWVVIYHSCGYHSCGYHDISWYIYINYYGNSIIAYHSKNFGSFCESLAVLHVVPTWTKKTGIWYCNAAKWHWIYSGDPVTKMNMPRRNNSSGQFGSTADPMKYFNSQTSFWVPDFEKVTCNDLATYWSNCPWNIQDSTFRRSHFWISCRDTKV